MSFETELNQIYQKIAQKINDMIPVEWKEFHFHAEIQDGDGGVYFFFQPSNKQEYVYSYFIPEVYGVEKSSFDNSEDELFDLAIDLQSEFIENEMEPWFSVTLSVDENRKIKIHFDYLDWNKSNFGPSDRMKYFQFKQLNALDLNENNKKLVDAMSEYEKINA
ncbi:DUF600 family protein [Listeria booriae]|uniref:DUF600 family protein n=1 Tax=Listeria booriae TaxID=1552123 RepID=A0A099WDW8_9LIST|nr:immunity protein YezG family protein [Listeria booriae]KGL42718.1 GNAT family acetyltransferase [Listeria booriae]MBC1796079.1 DUF600 family protein [Listeria booriae]MBC1896273.1 DUF600 family protein [Listeria booriae]MBC1906109.1 DUF600 family protein [Listeria booriae]MBC1984127.1 DUF600 family protein [Listeria booriae]